MIHLLFVLLAADVPAVTAGPDLVEAAAKVDAPIAQVTVYSDRARIERRARVALAAGAQTVQLPDLPGAVMMDTVRVGTSTGRVIRVEAVPVERERFSIEQVAGLLARLEALADGYQAKQAQRQVYDLELAVLSTIAPRGPVPEAERIGKAVPTLEPAAWNRVLDFLQQRRAAVRATVRKLDEERRLLGEQLAKVQREVGRHDLGAFTDRKIQVLAIVQADRAGQVDLRLEYFVPGASWKPTYDLTYAAASGRVELRTAGQVQQATGEAWTDVALSLSTAVPGRGIDLPEMRTWALGEQKEFIPSAVAARMPPEPPRFALPKTSRTPAEARRRAKLEVLAQRLAELEAFTGQALPDAHAVRLEELDRRVEQLKEQVFRSKARLNLIKENVLVGDLGGRKPTDARAIDRGQEAVATGSTRVQVELDADEDDGDYEYASAGGGGRYGTQSVSVKRPPPRAAKGMSRRPGGAKPEPAERIATTSLGLFEPGHYVPPAFSDPMLPAVVAGGLDYTWACPSQMTIPSTAEQIEVPLDLAEYPARVHYEATPSLREVAYLKAEVDNRGDRPILGGVVNIFMGPDFAGQGRLKTTGPGGTLPLPLGADEDIRLKRKVVPRTETEGVFSKDEVTTYAVTIEVGNYKRRPARIVLWDQVPKSGNEEIEIEPGKISPKPAKGPDVDGVIRWELSVPAGQTQKIEFSYKIERPENWQLSQ